MSPTGLMSPWRRNILEEVPDTLSSWDKCMAKSYCKYPVIVGIVIGSLVAAGLLWCMFRCLFCGAKCCCCCGSGKKKPSKYADPPGGHRGPAGPAQGFHPSPAPPVYQAPQFATFDNPSGKVNDDALPPMPSWDSATTRRIEDTTPAPTQDVELGRLDSTGQQYGGAVVPGGKTGRGGYSEVPSNPGSPVPGSRPGGGYRGTEPASYFPQNQTPAPYDNGYDNGTPAPGPVAGPGYGQYRTTSPYDQHQQRHASPSVYDGSNGGYRGQTTTSPPPIQRGYSPQQSHPQQQYPAQDGYRMYSPSIPNSPPPPFSSQAQSTYDMGYGNSHNRANTPAAMQAGRKPAPNTWRDV